MDINTIGTVVVAVATSATAMIAWRVWRQQQADREPVVELRHYWGSDGSLTLRVTVRNRLGESMVVEEAPVMRPRQARLTRERTQDKLGAETGFAPAKDARVVLNWNVAPVGHASRDRTGRAHAIWRNRRERDDCDERSVPQRLARRTAQDRTSPCPNLPQLEAQLGDDKETHSRACVGCVRRDPAANRRGPESGSRSVGGAAGPLVPL
jgi:hypothetical protein